MTLDDVHERSRETWTVRDPEAHRTRVRSMFARIAGVYDFMNHALSLNRDRAWRRSLVGRLDMDAWEVLDLCAGTCDLALACAAAGRGRELFAADFAPEMLHAGAAKPGADGLALAAADALALPFAAGSFDAVLVGFGMRNLADVRAGLAEAARVLRPGGQLLVVEFFRADPAAAGEARGASRPVRWALGRLLPLLGRLLGRDGPAYSYLSGSMGVFLSPGEFVQLLTEAGFEEPFMSRRTLGIAHLVGARRPV